MASGKPSCYQCKKPAYTRAPGATTFVCRKCYNAAVVDRVRRTVNRYQMLHDGDVIAVGLSGGKDSTVLLHILSQLEKSHPRSSLTAITIDEGIHGYRDEAIKCAQLAAEKAAIERFTQGLAEEVYPYNISVTALSPSELVVTPGSLYFKMAASPDDPRAEPPDMMARATLLLATEPVDKVTGRVTYSQAILKEFGWISEAKGVGADFPGSGFSKV